MTNEESHKELERILDMPEGYDKAADYYRWCRVVTMRQYDGFTGLKLDKDKDASTQHIDAV